MEWGVKGGRGGQHPYERRDIHACPSILAGTARYTFSKKNTHKASPPSIPSARTRPESNPIPNLHQLHHFIPVPRPFRLSGHSAVTIHIARTRSENYPKMTRSSSRDKRARHARSYRWVNLALPQQPRSSACYVPPLLKQEGGRGRSTRFPTLNVKTSFVYSPASEPPGNLSVGGSKNQRYEWRMFAPGPKTLPASDAACV